LTSPSANPVRATLRTGSWWLADKACTLGATLLSQVVLVRVLGSAGFGELSYLLALASLLLPILQMGLAGLVVRALLEPGSDERAVLQSALWLRLVGALVALTCGVIYWGVFEPQPEARQVFLVLCLSQIALVLGVVEFRFQARMEAEGFAPWRMSLTIAMSIVKIIVGFTTRDVALVALVFALENVLLGTVQALAYRRASGHWLQPQRDTPWISWYLARAPWLFLSGIAAVLYLKIDIVMLGWLRGSEETGVYAAAARLSEVWYAVPVVIVATIFPPLLESRADTARWQRNLQRGLDGLVAIALVIALVMQFAAAPLIRVLFGEAFAGSAPILALHIWAALFVFMRELFSRWLIAEDLLAFSLLTHGAGAIVNVLLNLWLIPAYGGLGAALATVISYATAGWLALFLHARTRPFALQMTRALLLPLRPRAIAEVWRLMR